MDSEPLVRVEVVVNVDSMRRGQVGEVELSDRIQALIDRGYLKLLGHVHVAEAFVKVPPPPPELLEPPAPPEAPARRSRPSRAKRDPLVTPSEGSDGDSPGGSDLE